jgi:thioredoxin-dependent peroxiredoxin
MKYITLNFVVLLLIPLFSFAGDLNVGDTVPDFSTSTHEGKTFQISERKGQWTVLYFYPKADTPGCTKQACAFRDHIELIRKQGAEIYGISTDSVADQAAFHKKHTLNFTLLADPDSKITEMFGSRMPILKMSKRWTYVIDPELKIRAIEKDVDPAKDAERVAKQIQDLKGK